MAYRKKDRQTRTVANTLEGRLYRPEEAGDYLNIAPQTLAHWRVRGTGPHFIHLSKRCIRYSEQALKEWLESRTIASTVER